MQIAGHPMDELLVAHMDDSPSIVIKSHIHGTPKRQLGLGWKELPQVGWKRIQIWHPQQLNVLILVIACDACDCNDVPTKSMKKLPGAIWTFRYTYRVEFEFGSEEGLRLARENNSFQFPSPRPNIKCPVPSVHSQLKLFCCAARSVARIIGGGNAQIRIVEGVLKLRTLLDYGHRLWPR